MPISVQKSLVLTRPLGGEGLHMGSACWELSTVAGCRLLTSRDEATRGEESHAS